MFFTKNGIVIITDRDLPALVQHWISKEAHGCSRKPLKSFTPSAPQQKAGASLEAD